MLEDEPEIYDDLLCYWQAFLQLSSSRQSGMFSVGHIHYSEIVCYLDENDIDGYEERLDYIKWIQFIDTEYLKMIEDKQSKKKK